MLSEESNINKEQNESGWEGKVVFTDWFSFIVSVFPPAQAMASGWEFPTRREVPALPLPHLSAAPVRAPCFRPATCARVSPASRKMP